MKNSRKSKLHDLTKGQVVKHLKSIMRQMKESEKKFSDQLGVLHNNFTLSGTNLIHYLVLRSNEIRDIQEYLHHKGLSSLTNSESHTLSQVQNVLGWLQNKQPITNPVPCDFEAASQLCQDH